MNPDSVTSGRMGRPLGFKREQSIEAAMHLFWQKGVEPVSAKDLAGAMGIQRSSFYNSFGDKEAVFREVLQYYGEIAPDRHLENIAPNQPVIPEIRIFLKELCRIRASDPQARGCMICNGIAELSSSDSNLGRMLNELLRQRIRRMRQLFTQAIQQNEVAQRAPDTLAHGFIAFLLGLNILSKVVREESALWNVCESYLQGLTSGAADDVPADLPP